jgi:hypothetical protein
MAARIDILRPESVTPIDRFLDRVCAEPGSYARQIEFACVLLYREREYRAMYASSWRPDRLPVAGSDVPFLPRGLTSDAAEAIASTVRSVWGLGPADATLAPDDLFGLKAGALAGLGRVLRPTRAHAFGHLVASRLAKDLCRYEEAIALARTALDAGADAATSLAVAYDSAIVAPQVDSTFDGAAVAAELERSARARLSKARQWRHDWNIRALERMDEQIRRHAIRSRTAVEGKAFTRFLATETGYCERERADAHKGFQAGLVPRDLRELVPIAKRYGVGDDVCRGMFVRQTPARERARIVSSIESRLARIDEWLKSLGEPPYGREASAFFWLLEAVEDMRPARR